MIAFVHPMQIANTFDVWPKDRSANKLYMVRCVEYVINAFLLRGYLQNNLDYM